MIYIMLISYIYRVTHYVVPFMGVYVLSHILCIIVTSSKSGAPAGFQARVGKIRRQAPKNFFRLPTWFSVCPPCHT